MIASEHLTTGKRSQEAQEGRKFFFLQRHKVDELTLELVVGSGTQSGLLNPVQCLSTGLFPGSNPSRETGLPQPSRVIKGSPMAVDMQLHSSHQLQT